MELQYAVSVFRCLSFFEQLLFSEDLHDMTMTRTSMVVTWRWRWWWFKFSAST